MRESGEPMEFGIFDFYKVFSRAFGEGVMGQRGLRMEAGGCRHVTRTLLRFVQGIGRMLMDLIF